VTCHGKNRSGYAQKVRASNENMETASVCNSISHRGSEPPDSAVTLNLRNSVGCCLQRERDSNLALLLSNSSVRIYTKEGGIVCALRSITVFLSAVFCWIYVALHLYRNASFHDFRKTHSYTHTLMRVYITCIH